MTVLIAAILHGRTKEEWYAWVTDRVKKGYGYDTPSTHPQLYSQSRLMSFRARKEAQEAREQARKKEQEDDDSVEGLLAGSGLGGFSRVLSSTGGISFTPSSGIVSDSGTLMFANEDSDDDDSGDEEVSLFNDTLLGLGRPESPDPTKDLKAKLDAFEKDIQEDGPNDDGDSHMADTKPEDESRAKTSEPSSNASQHLQGEAPPPPKPTPNGDALGPVTQLHSPPYGDEPLPVVKAEGLMDSSEDPLVKA